jgi:hypothetical protein
MGDQLDCKARFNGMLSTGKAYLETDKLLFRGDVRVSVPFKEITAISSDSKNLKVTFPKGTLVLELGAQAAKWQTRIRSPKRLLDKLGVKPDSKVSVLGVDDQDFWADLQTRAAHISKGRPAKGSDHLFFRAEDPKALERLESLKSYIKANGAIWVVFPKGKKHIREIDVIQAAKQSGLVDNKVVAFSATHTGLRLVIPLALR